jgi:DNA (cytosine-5)-methyltransferase 1
VSQTLDAVLAKGQTMPEKNRFPAVLQPVCATGDTTHCLTKSYHGSEDGTGRGLPIVPFTASSFGQYAHGVGTICANGGDLGGGSETLAVQPMAVRRLTPIECERLQGFPDNWSRISWKGKPETECPDGPRYKACGNSMAVPVMRWIGERIAVVDSTLSHNA